MDNLIGNMEIPEPTFGSPLRHLQEASVQPTNSNGGVSPTLSRSPGLSPVRPSTSSYTDRITSPTQETDVEVGIGHLSYRKQNMSAASYYARIYYKDERDETIKCIVSSMLFVAIVVVLIVFMFTVNPEM